MRRLMLFLVLTALASPPAARAAEPWQDVPDAGKILELVKLQYEATRDVPRRLQINVTTRTRSLDAADIQVRALNVVHQRGAYVRSEIIEGQTSVPAASTAVASAKAFTRNVWMHDGKETTILFETAPQGPAFETETIVKKVDHTRLPPELGTEFTDPMRSAEILDVMGAEEFTARWEVQDGRPVYALRSRGAIQVNPDSDMEVKFFVDPESYLILAMDTTLTYKTPDMKAPYFVDLHADIVNEFNVSMPEAIFELAAPQGVAVQDITAEVHKSGMRKLEWVKARAAAKTAKPAKPAPEGH